MTRGRTCSIISSAYTTWAKALDTGRSEPRRVRGTSHAGLTSCPKNRQQARSMFSITRQTEEDPIQMARDKGLATDFLG